MTNLETNHAQTRITLAREGPDSMKMEDLWQGLLALDGCWEITEIGSRPSPAPLIIGVREKTHLWTHEICPKCNGGPIVAGDHGPADQWRHLDVVGRPAFLECALPQGQCRKCLHWYVVKPPWQGRSKAYTRQFETHVLELIKATGIAKTCQLTGETESRVWSIVFAHVDQPLQSNPNQIIYRQASPDEQRETDSVDDFDHFDLRHLVF